MPHVDEVFEAAASLSPDDRVSLIARLWKSLPQESWPRPAADDLVEADRILAKENVLRNENVPWQLAVRMMADSVRSSRPKVYSAPRRFDLSTVLVITTGYALLFGALGAIFDESEYAAGVALLVGVFVTLVGVGQALLYGGRKPRTASIVVGAVVTAPYVIGTTMFFARRGMPAAFLPFSLIYSVVSGAIYGYLAGVLVGGVFMVADLIRRQFKDRPLDTAGASPSASSPFDAG